MTSLRNGLRNDDRGKGAGETLLPAPRSRDAAGGANRGRRVQAAKLVTLSFLGLLGLVGGCVGLTANNPVLPGETTADGADGAANADAGKSAAFDAATTIVKATPPIADGAAAADVAAAASPLCGGTYASVGGSCKPDAPSCIPTAVDAGAPTAADAGAVSPDSDAATPNGHGSAGHFGCHVTATSSDSGAGTITPVCTAAGSGRAESACTASSDCAPSFECVLDGLQGQVDGTTAGGVCRKYCCDNVCDAALGAFCDIEMTLNGALSVPVCATRTGPANVYADAGAACELLNDVTCGSSGLTCEVVNPDNGQVACVTPGTATAGESCEQAKCAKGFSCIDGYFPNRVCAQLCDLENANCPSGETCIKNAAFSSVNAQVGVCTE